MTGRPRDPGSLAAAIRRAGLPDVFARRESRVQGAELGLHAAGIALAVLGLIGSAGPR